MELLEQADRDQTRQYLELLRVVHGDKPRNLERRYNNALKRADPDQVNRDPNLAMAAFAQAVGHPEVAQEIRKRAWVDQVVANVLNREN